MSPVYPENTSEGDTIPRRVEITEPCLLPGLDALTYHQDPVPDGSISSTALKVMVEQSPKHAREYQLNGRPPKREFDLGSAVHTIVLGDGVEVAYWGTGEDSDSWRGKEPKAFYDNAQARGAIPLLRKEQKHVDGMVAAVRADERLAQWLEPGAMDPEQSGFWVDPRTGLWCRLRTDAMHPIDEEGLLVVVDVKTGHSVMPDAIAKAIADWRYDLQEAHYLAGLWKLMELGLLTESDVLYALAFVEKTPPYDVVIRQIGPKTRVHAQIQRRWGLERFATCRDTGTWPGYDDPAQRDDDEIPEIEVPGWKLSRWDYKTENGDYDVPEF